MSSNTLFFCLHLELEVVLPGFEKVKLAPQLDDLSERLFRFDVFSALENAFLLLRGILDIFYLNYCRDVGSQSDVVEPLLLKSRQNVSGWKLLKGKLSFCFTVASGSCLSFDSKLSSSNYFGLSNGDE